MERTTTGKLIAKSASLLAVAQWHGENTALSRAALPRVEIFKKFFVSADNRKIFENTTRPLTAR